MNLDVNIFTTSDIAPAKATAVIYENLTIDNFAVVHGAIWPQRAYDDALVTLNSYFVRPHSPQLQVLTHFYRM